MSHALATVRHDGRRPSVTPGKRVPSSVEPGTGDRSIGHEPQGM